MSVCLPKTNPGTRRDLRSFFVIVPEHPWWVYQNYKNGGKLPDGFRYASDSNS